VDGHSLALAYRELIGQMMEAVAEAEPLKPDGRYLACFSLRVAVDGELDERVLER